MGLWLLVPEYLRLGAWDLIKGVFDNESHPLSSQLALQMVNESALCVHRIRKKDSLCHQGFSLVNGLSFLATDESVHKILDSNRIEDYERLQKALFQLRKLDGHYLEEASILAIDPHRICSTTRRIMPKKKKRPDEPSNKTMQTFFCNDVFTGQPLGFSLASAGKTCSNATLELLELIEAAGVKKSLIVADKEHFTQSVMEYFYHHPTMDMLVPAPEYKTVVRKAEKAAFRKMWAGYAVGETAFSFKGSPLSYRLLVQREGEIPADYKYTAFLSTSQKKIEELLTVIYDKRWSIEEFFNFEGDMGWNRASTFNLNIRYGRQTLALIAQAATYQLKQKLPAPYSQWSAASLSQKVLTNMEGDIRVQGNKIIITYYKDHSKLNLEQHYADIGNRLRQEGVSPKIPWLFDFEIDFRFK